jgi:hypothetical protein
MCDKRVGFGEYKRDWKMNDSSLFVSVLLVVKVAKDARFFFPPPLKPCLSPPLCRRCLLNPELERRERGRRRNIIIISVRYYGEQTTTLFLWQLIG